MKFQEYYLLNLH